MNQKELSELTDEELIAEAKKMKSSAIMNTFFIGFLIGIVIFSIVKSSFGMVMLIPLYFIYRLVNGPKNDQALKAILKERNLK